jgi:hypothetical protein
MIDAVVLSDEKLTETIQALEASLECKRSRNKIASYLLDDDPSGVSFTQSISSFFDSGKFTWSAPSWRPTA